MSGDETTNYDQMKRRRNAYQGQITKITNSVRRFNIETDSSHLLKTARESIGVTNSMYQILFQEMLDHVEADEDEILEHAERFRYAHATVAALIEDSLEDVRKSNQIDNLPALKDDLFAIELSFEDFKIFSENCEPESMDLSEIRVRLKDLEPMSQQFLDTWKKIYVRENNERREAMKIERSEFFKQFYQTMAWFHSKIPVRASTPSTTSSTPTRDSLVRLPQIELPTFDGSPDSWITFRDTYVSLVHNVNSLSGALKFRYLKTSIKDKNSPIKHLLETDSGYEDAWAAVLDFYDDKRRILDCHLTAILKVKPMEAESHDELQRVLNEYSLHISSLERMHSEQELYRAILAHVVLQRLDAHTRDLWETDNKGDTPFWPDLQQFLKDRRKTLSSMPTPKPTQVKIFQKSSSKPAGKSSNVLASSKSPPAAENAVQQESLAVKSRSTKCYMCGNDHRLQICPEFINLPIPNRLAKVTEWKVCTSCFGNHALNSCQSKFRCRSCKQRHNTLLHMEQSPATPRSAAHSIQTPQSSLQATATPFSFPSTSCNHASIDRNNVTLLQTAMVQLLDAQGEWHTARAFLDSGSDSNFMTSCAAKALNFPFEPTHVEANGLGGNRAAVIKHKLRTQVGSSTERFSMEFLIAPKITNPTPSVPVAVKRLEIPPNLSLADPTFDIPGKIDILIGNEHYGELLRDGKIKLAAGATLLNTVFGWIFTGSVPPVNVNCAEGAVQRSTHSITTQCHHNTLHELKDSVEKFYKQEDYRNQKRFLTEEETNCEQHFEQTYQRSATGRFVVTIPFKENLSMLKNNFKNALSQFLASEKRWQKNESLRSRVIGFMREYEMLGHMTVVDTANESPDEPAFYFPYHAVENPDSTTTKLRVVFNGSARTPSGISLNETQCVGPQIQCDVFILSLRFRIHAIVIKGDIEKMYRQIEVAEHQRRFQRIIFRETPNEKLRIYELKTVTYGTSAASYLSTRCLLELGIVNRERFPEAAEDIINSFYVDDYISGAASVEDAKKLKEEVVDILSGAQMKLRKFSSNSTEFMEMIPEELRDTVSDDNTIKALGAKWNPQDDTIGFVTRSVRYENVTRRIILSEIASNFDADGLLGPVTFRFKKFMKLIFKLSQPWDAPIPPKEAEEWKEIASTFEDIGKIRISRHVVIKNFTDVQLHGFCDASEAGYGACIYVVSTNAEGQTVCRLLCAKSRISPKEYRSIARLELCGAVILANLMDLVAKNINLPFSKTVCWSDSAIILHWLKKCPSVLQTFVANRVSEIQELSKSFVWRHVRGELNPADLISRGLTPAEILVSNLWWFGPEFLTHPENMWPESIVKIDPSEPTFSQEFKRVEIWTHATSTNDAIQPLTLNPFLDMIEKSSRTFNVKWKIAPIMRFIYNARANSRNIPRRKGPIQTEDLIDAENALARIYQAEHFADEFRKCSNGLSVPAKSKLKNLDPMWDSNLKLLRVGGRLNRATRCTENQKHPIILPSCHFARLIIREAHESNLHAGQNATHSFVRLRYWPIRAKNIVKQEVHRCVKCFRARPRMTEQLMGQLPPERVTPSPPFYNTGVDFCGPFDMKVSKLRTAKTIKSYVSIFVCLSTKAVHMEIVTDLTTEAFLAAFDKFVSRRGLPHSMSSDNGLNFVGANNELKKLYKFIAIDTTQNEIRNYLAKQEICWNFIPPRAPSQGGLWEAAVKSMKHHFYRVASTALLTFEEFDRLKSKIEAILNSRPLTALSEDPSDLSALTAGHFLIGRPLIAKPDRDFTQHAITRLQRWDRVVNMQQNFWQRWSRDYLHQLQVRTKNYKSIVPVSVGQLVLMHVDNCPSMHWPLGKIIDIFPGKDGVTRVAKIRTATTTFERPINKLALLPMDLDENHSEAPEDVRA